MGVAFTCGLEKVVLPSFKLGMPVEYELVRSIATVGRRPAEEAGRRQTDAQMMGGFSFAGMQPRQIPKQLILEELEKQYKVEEVDPTNPIEPGRYDVLLVVQPRRWARSSWPTWSMRSRRASRRPFLKTRSRMSWPGRRHGRAEAAAWGRHVRHGRPAAAQGRHSGSVERAGNSSDRRRRRLAASRRRAKVVWQDYNPYPEVPGSRHRAGAGLHPRRHARRNERLQPRRSRWSPNFEEVLFPYPTGISQAIGSKLKFTELVSTSRRSPARSRSMIAGQPVDPALLDEKRGKPTEAELHAGRLDSRRSARGGDAEADGDKAAKERAVDKTRLRRRRQRTTARRRGAAAKPQRDQRDLRGRHRPA